jgi:hypothetical protein
MKDEFVRKSKSHEYFASKISENTIVIGGAALKENGAMPVRAKVHRVRGREGK